MADQEKQGFVIGVDFGTDSCRSLVVNALTGEQYASAVAFYPRWKAGHYCQPDQGIFRQHPQDYIDAFKSAVRDALAKVDATVRASVRGISIDTTGSTSVAINRDGVPLALTEPFSENPNAMFVLWKDHSAVQEADEINRLARGWGGIDFTRFVGGVYSAEWFWANMLHVLRVDAQVREHAHSWVEHCDWMPALLTGVTASDQIKRSRCAAGHKAMWHESFDGLPSEDFLTQLDPLLAGMRSRLYRDTHTSESAAGTLSPEWAAELGLTTDVVVGVGAFDAHMGAVGAGIRPYVLVKVMGTSTCDVLMAPLSDIGDRVVSGICGQVEGSVIEGMVGMEAGQSAFGDVYAWFRQLLGWPLALLGDTADAHRQRDEIMHSILPELERQAAKEDPLQTGIVAIDWLNGRRTPFADQTLRGALFGLSLGSDAPKIYRALIEATAFGARAIVDRFRDEGIRIDGVIAVGGVAKKSPLNMQIVADVFGLDISVARSDQAVALGAAMFAAVAAGLHENVEAAQLAMGSAFETVYRPAPLMHAVYSELYHQYLELGALIEQAMGRPGQHTRHASSPELTATEPCTPN
jgi:L-ribulokinase